MKVLAFAASLREQSLNKKLIAVAAEIARARGVEVELADFREFDIPIYDGDANEKTGLPAGAVAFTRRLGAADALLISSPEYNYSIAGAFKNLIDWVSRVRPMPWRGKSIYLMSAAPSPMGGIRGLWQTRIPLEGCGSLVFPDMFALPHADKAFDETGKLADPALMDRLNKELSGFLQLAEALLPIYGKPESSGATQKQKDIAAALEAESELQPNPSSK